MKILIVEDENELSDSISTYLTCENYTCEIADNFITARKKSELFDYDCILLDITMPGGNGLEILKELKTKNKADGVLIISAKNSLEDKVTGLMLGADDYLTKPFHLSELSARVAAIIRRKNYPGNYIIKLKNITIDTHAKSVVVANQILDLTKKEYALLLYFATNENRLISKNAIAEHLWGENMEGNNDFLYTHIKNLRRKLSEVANADYIKSIYGMGYKFSI